MPSSDETYDLAVSFAGEQRTYVEDVVRACESRGLSVFYDRNVTVDLWGRNFIRQFRKVYGGSQVRYFVPFLSVEYLSKAYPMDEFHTAMLQAVERGTDDYILPVLMGKVDVPADLLNQAIGYLRAEKYAPDKLSAIIEQRVRVNRQGRTRQNNNIADPVGVAPGVRLPRIAPTTFSTFDTMAETLSTVGREFGQRAKLLEPYGYQCRVRPSDSAVTVRVEDRGQPICGLELRLDNSIGEEALVYQFEWPTIRAGNAYSGRMTAVWDPESNAAKLKFFDFAGHANPVLVTAEQLVTILWNKIVDFVERRRR